MSQENEEHEKHSHTDDLITGEMPSQKCIPCDTKHHKSSKRGSKTKSRGSGGGSAKKSGSKGRSSSSKSKGKSSGKSSSPPSIICRLCEKRFTGQQALEKHMVSKHPRVECKVCRKTFINDQALKIHTRNKHASKPSSRRASQLNADAPSFVPGGSFRGSTITLAPGPGGGRRRSGEMQVQASAVGVPFSGSAPTMSAQKKIKKERRKSQEEIDFEDKAKDVAKKRRDSRREERKSRRLTLPQPDPKDLEGDAPAINYNIGAGWVVYWNPPTSLEHSTHNEQYMKSLREIADFQGVANFWGKIANLQKPSKITHGAHNFMVFRKGLVPAWESFVAGGAWIINYHRWEEETVKIDAVWETVMFGLASEAFGTPEVVGASCHIRTRGYRICIWNRDNRVGDVRFQIADKLRMLLSLHPRKEIKYKYFSCCLKDGSTTSQATPYQFVKVTF